MKAHLNTPEAFEVMVFNQAGQVIWQESSEKKSNWNSTLDLTKYANGIYMVVLKTTSGTIHTQKIVKAQ